MKRTLTADEVIDEIAEVLRQGDEEFIEKIANMVLVPKITRKGKKFVQETE